MKNIIVVGNGMVGYKFCEKLVEASKDFKITVFGEEPIPAYDRVHLSEYFSDSSIDKLMMAPKSWYEENGITLRTNELITQIDRDNKTVTSHLGNQFVYDKLIMATGSAAFVPRIDGAEKKGVFVYRTIEDLDAIISYGQKVKSAAVLGGGLLGLEAAKAVMDMGLQTHVIEFAPRLMPRQLDDDGSGLLKEKLEDLGIVIHLQKNTKKIHGNGKLTGLEFSDGEKLPVEMLVISAGIIPRDELGRQAGLELGQRGGLQVNEYLQTSDPDIFAIGEVASCKNMIYGLVAPGYEMASQVVNQLTGKPVKPFTGFDMSTKLKLIGVEVGSFGNPLCIDIASKTIVYKDKNKGLYKRINVSQDGKK
ncbi:MAG: FAD-dependent oxidoreductase, partial [Cyclobacteriaceae bacterium]